MSKILEYKYNSNNPSPYKVYFPRGSHFVELYGASGGCTLGGKGGYSSGTLFLRKSMFLYLYIGGQGLTGSDSTSGLLKGGWNGGGEAWSDGLQCSGGGATDIRLTENDEYNERIIIAGGGGGAAYSSATDTKYSGGYGGGESGGDAIGASPRISIPYGQLYAKGGTSTEPGTAVIMTATYTNSNGNKNVGGKCAGGYKGCGGGGGGYFGGAGGYDYTGGGGGSGFFDIRYIKKGKLLNGSEKGNTGNGYIIITFKESLCSAKIVKNHYSLFFISVIIS